MRSQIYKKNNHLLIEKMKKKKLSYVSGMPHGGPEQPIM